MDHKPELLAKLSLFDATLLVIGSVIGSGIFLTTGIIAESLPHPGWILAVWAVGAVLTLFGGLTLAELGGMMPEAGGQYVYLRNTYGPLAGFLYGWLTFLVTHTGGIAALAVGFTEYLSYFYPALGLRNYIVIMPWLSISTGQLVAVGTILLLTAVNYFGIRSGSMVQNVFTMIKLIAIAILVVSGIYIFSLNSGAPVSAGIQSHEIPGSMFAAIGIALIAVLWTFDGWYAVNSVASEIKNPKKNLPLSLIAGISTIGLIYILINMFYVYALPVDEISGVVRVGETTTTALFGETAGSAMTALILVSIFGCLSATIVPGPRIYYAMAKDGVFFEKFSRVHEKYHSPSVAIIWQGIWASVLCLSGTYEELYTYVVFTTLLFFIAQAIAIFVLRIKKPDLERPYKVWGYPVVPILFGLAMLLIAMNSVMERPVESIVGFVLLVAGLPVYAYWRRSRSR